MLSTTDSTAFVERLLAGWLFGFAGKSIRELAAIVGDNFANFQGCSGV